MLTSLILLLPIAYSVAEYRPLHTRADNDASRGAANNPLSYYFPSGPLKVGRHKARAFAPRSPNTITSNTLPIISHQGTSISKRYLQALYSHDAKRSIDGLSPLIEASKGNVYLTPIQFGNQSFYSVIDTGSSDTWLVGNEYQCFDLLDRSPVASHECRFGPSYNFTPTFQLLSDRHFNISYADGEFLNGIMGQEDVTLAGITVSQQTVGVVDYAAWMGDGKSSGLLGLAYPNITRAYLGNNTKADRRGGNIPYSPLFTSMWRQNLTAPLFSVALGRGAQQPGVLALGGLPGPPVRYASNFAKADIEFLTIAMSNGTVKSQTEYQMYTITAGFAWSKASSRWVSPVKRQVAQSKSSSQVIVDSGTTLIFLPSTIAAEINNLWTPKAQYNTLSQTYFVRCNATPPRFAVTIDGQQFWIDPKDMIQDAGVGNMLCISGIQPGSDGVSIVGDVFMKSVLAVFDVGAGEMRFATRY